MNKIRACETMAAFREAAAQLQESGVIKDLVDSMPAQAQVRRPACPNLCVCAIRYLEARRADAPCPFPLQESIRQPLPTKPSSASRLYHGITGGSYCF